ncbi:hypothetical protein [Flavobacterium sp.]|uniref:hypothetical protein n=1 Tax=Flavobacterium sp. TaxID=239 RepID=UPI00286A6F6B|nr:hypothetical protein [Flavobacterium sp.]
MEVLTILFDILKLLIPSSIGILTLSISFIDKIGLNLNDDKVKSTIILLWVCLILTIVGGFVSSVFIYDDITATSTSDYIVRSLNTRIAFSLTFLTFIISIIALVMLGFQIIERTKNADE